ncbi:MAG: HAD hydrolase-like protein, partial [Flavobacteriaceae bacterium]|nr:HAD hydrolase-like protein [Flavobacteriaceae bacterium]
MIKIPSNIKALIFDCDGTLVDTMPIHMDAWKIAFEMNGREFPYDFIDSLKGTPLQEIVQIYNKEFNDNIDFEKVSKIKYGLTHETIKKAKPIKPVVDVALKHHNIMPMSVASGGSEYNVHASLTSAGILNLFSPILTSKDKIPGKPKPDIFLECAKQMNVAPENCLVFEDGDFVFAHTEYDFATRNVGFEIFRFENNQAVEHWDNIQKREEPNIFGYSMVDGEHNVMDYEKTESNRMVIQSFVHDVLIQGNFENMDDYINEEHYAEHSPHVGDEFLKLSSALSKSLKDDSISV